MKRILLSASIFGAILATAVAPATADTAVRPDAGPATIQSIADASSGSSDLLGALLLALSTGSAQECDGVMLDACVPLPAQPASAQQAVLIAEPSSGSSAIIDGILLDIVEIASGSSAKCDGLPPGHCTPYPR
ncbi:hypothetical protein [Nocardia fluminea]|uniref:hypothetical protein n=1 Tax=Nocardia fluminea TaxID=134984 RepID=UPI003445C0B0